MKNTSDLLEVVLKLLGSIHFEVALAKLEKIIIVVLQQLSKELEFFVEQQTQLVVGTFEEQQLVLMLPIGQFRSITYRLLNHGFERRGHQQSGLRNY